MKASFKPLLRSSHVVKCKHTADDIFRKKDMKTHTVAMKRSEYYINAEFRDTILLHIMKNFYGLSRPCPLILGIWGAKNQGKTFQTQKILADLQINTVIIRACELESSNLIRTRYHEAAGIIDSGKLCALLIKDLDDGLGHKAYSTLMDIADSPEHVQLPGLYNQQRISKVPIIIIANDLNNLNDGRITKYEWIPSLNDKFELCKLLFQNLDDFQLKMFVEKYEIESLNFFVKIKSELLNKELLHYANSKDYDILVSEMIHGASYIYDDNISMKLQNILQIKNYISYSKCNIYGVK